ncbi:helix-turn-helix domain-containing protein [Fulvivirga sp. M361]|uniref:helix-turn-helix domain-containing protein n=1 Tax=Fulvivirga sp. M361 TaxID=2594266 RepID=UPI00117A93C0|nr:XRE family transcriptional regulator [Fulvivirga sp. M361]TRX50877.1 helix-turn-helix domain-containing protein [Fulvivirga sp. M361]
MTNGNFQLKHIFGLKIRDLRMSKDLSFQELSEKTGLSVSYLSEIEKGKKYPKGDKILALAEALKVTYDYLVSLRVSKKLEPIINLMQSDFFKEFPLETFGLDPQKVIELLSQAPEKINAFITSVITIARNYEMRGEHFYFAALRSYQELHDNYFPEIEEAASQFRKEHGALLAVPVSVNALKDILNKTYGIKLDRRTLSTYESLRDLRCYYNAKEKKVLLNQGLTREQESFLLGREIAFQYLDLAHRPMETPPQRGDSFEAILSNYKASYFSAALILPEEKILKDVHKVAASPSLDTSMMVRLIDKYRATPEMLMQRLTNMLPKHFKIKNLFFLRFVGTDNFSFYNLTKELHLARFHNPHANGVNEHYCRRWLAIRMIKQLRTSSRIGKANAITSGAQISKYHGTEDDYLCLSLAFPNVSNPAESMSVTIGFYIDDDLRKKVRFIQDPKIKSRVVNTTCERCSWTECEDRIAPPVHVEKEARREDIWKALEEIRMKGEVVN